MTDEKAIEAAARAIYATGLVGKNLELESQVKTVARAALIAAERAAWRPIEDENGDHDFYEDDPILATDGKAVRVTWWDAAACAWAYAEIGGIYRLWDPTHWRPLPAPPDGGGDV